MTRLLAVADYIPADGIDNIEQGARLGESRAFIENRIGAVYLPQKAADEESSDMAVQAVHNLLAKTGLSPVLIEALVVVTQNGDGNGLPHTSAIVHAKLGLPTQMAVFDVSLGCSGYVYGLHILKGVMQLSGMQNAVLVTVDPYSKVIDRTDRVTSLLFGDAATATWLSVDGGWELSNALMGSDGSGAAAIEVRDQRLTMNGRKVFNFAATTISGHLRELLEREGLVETDIDLYCLHQGSRNIVDTISRQFPPVQGRFVNDMRETGNTVSSSIPLLLEKALDQSDTQRIAICGFGVGLSWASMILTRRELKYDHS